jgi:hypothetical protein
MPTPAGSETVDELSKFYAVVLHHEAGSSRRVRWSPTARAWLSSHAYARYRPDPWLDSPEETFGRPDTPYEAELVAAVELASKVTAPQTRFFCQRCWQSSPAFHFIAPDVYGDPELYCVQVPSFTVVNSSGGNGTLKHWGSPFGCQSVQYAIDSDLYTGTEYIGPRAGYVYGQPLPAEEVINRDWCSRCQGHAYNARSNASSKGGTEAELARKNAKMHVRQLGRELIDYFGE